MMTPSEGDQGKDGSAGAAGREGGWVGRRKEGREGGRKERGGLTLIDGHEEKSADEVLDGRLSWRVSEGRAQRI
jgi:hypothetical protein